MTARILFFLVFLFSINIHAQRTISPKTTQTPASQNDQTTDELFQHLSAAETYQLSGDLVNAGLENRVVLGIALQRAGNIAIEEGNYADAVALLTESITYTDNAPVRTNLAVAYQRLNQIENAVAQARIAVSKDPKYVGAHYVLGNIFFTKDDFKAALPELEKVISLAPDFDVAQALGLTYLHLKQLDRAKLLFEEIQISAGKQKAEIHLLFARAYEKTNYPLEAEREIRRALGVNPKYPRANFYLGYLLLQQGGSERLGEAGAAFDEELKLTPDDFYSSFFAGVVASSEGNHEKAIRYLQKAIKLNSQRGEAYLFLAQSQTELNDLLAAEKSLRQAVELEGGQPEKDLQSRRTHFMLGRLLLRTGRREEGEKELKLSQQLQEKSIQTARDEISQILGNVAGDAEDKTAIGQNPVTQKFELTPQRAADLKKFKVYLSGVLGQSFHNLGVIAVQTGQSTDALDWFASASKWKPDLPGLDRNTGIVNFRAGQFDKAVAPLARHLKTNPQDKLARRMLGVSYYLTKDFDASVATLKPLDADLLNDAELAYFYGISLIQLKRNLEATPIFNKLAEISQKNANALFYAGQGFMILGDYARAVKELRTVVELSPSTPKAHYFIGQNLIRLNSFEEAEKAFSRELELNPMDVLSKYHLALTFIERKTETEKAVAILLEALVIKSDYADARYQLGKIYLERGETDKAIDELEKAVSADPNKDYTHYQLSIAYRKASRKADADRALKRYQELKAVNRKPDSPMGNDGDPPK